MEKSGRCWVEEGVWGKLIGMAGKAPTGWIVCVGWRAGWVASVDEWDGWMFRLHCGGFVRVESGWGRVAGGQGQGGFGFGELVAGSFVLVDRGGSLRFDCSGDFEGRLALAPRSLSVFLVAWIGLGRAGWVRDVRLRCVESGGSLGWVGRTRIAFGWVGWVLGSFSVWLR